MSSAPGSKKQTTLISTVMPLSTGGSGSRQTYTSVIVTSASSASADPLGKGQNKGANHSSHLRGGGIAGVVVGCVAGVSLICALGFFLWFRRRNAKPDEDNDFAYSSNSEEKSVRFKGSGSYGKSNRFSSANRNDNYMFYNIDTPDGVSRDNLGLIPPPLSRDDSSSLNGRRRLSNGSLPDMAARNKGSLKVVNN